MANSLCLHCSQPLPRTALTGRTRKFCDGRCRKAAQRARDRVAVAVAATVEALPPHVADALTAAPEVGDYLRYLVEHRIRLNALLERGDEVTAHRLSREYRETLREINSVITGASSQSEEFDDASIESIGSFALISS